MDQVFAHEQSQSIATYVCSEENCANILSAFSSDIKTHAELIGFQGKLGQSMFLVHDGDPLAFLGFGNVQSRARHRFPLAFSAANLPDGVYRLAEDDVLEEDDIELLGWYLDQYRFTRYTAASAPDRKLVLPPWANEAYISALLQSEILCRDLINTPASDLGPSELASAAIEVSKQYDASVDIISGANLLKRNFPMIHAVGRASAQEPCLIDLKWGRTGPKITIVGKGVCFDTGGLDLKPAAGMALMKKDMGGAANTLALASMIMQLQLPIRLRVLIPAVENAVSGDAFRPKDILTSRKGLSVEVNNTDAEGRLILADALTYASEDNPDFIISLATLTGAARVALGQDVVPFFSGSNDFTTSLMRAGDIMQDPVWPLPFWEPYETMIEPGIADLDNAPSGGFGGAITAALFLRRFVSDPSRYAHFDIFSWSSQTLPGRPKGGNSTGARAILHALQKFFDI